MSLRRTTQYNMYFSRCRRNTSSSLRAAAIYFSRRSLRESLYPLANQRISLKEGGCPHGLLGWPSNNFEANLRMQDNLAEVWAETCFDAQYKFHPLHKGDLETETHILFSSLIDKLKLFQPLGSTKHLGKNRSYLCLHYRVASHWFLPNRKLLPASFG